MYGYTPLYWAAIRKQVDLVSLLLSMGADPNGLTKDLVTPLFGAAQKGCVKCIQLLIGTKERDEVEKNRDKERVGEKRKEWPIL